MALFTPRAHNYHKNNWCHEHMVYRQQLFTCMQYSCIYQAISFLHSQYKSFKHLYLSQLCCWENSHLMKAGKYPSKTIINSVLSFKISSLWRSQFWTIIISNYDEYLVVCNIYITKFNCHKLTDWDPRLDYMDKHNIYKKDGIDTEVLMSEITELNLPTRLRIRLLADIIEFCYSVSSYYSLECS